MPPQRTSAAGLVFALLVVLTLAAFAFSERLKRAPLVIDNVSLGPVFSPRAGCPPRRGRIRFRVTLSAHATVQVIDHKGGLVATLARERFLRRYHFFSFQWNGRSRRGAAAAPGLYRVRIKLVDRERSLVPPGTIRLRRSRPGSPGRCRRAMKGGH